MPATPTTALLGRAKEILGELITFDTVSENPNLPILQPDVVRGGLTDLRKTAAIADTWGMTIAPHLYPVRSRSAGLSIAIGVGRVGGVASPLLAGYLFDNDWTQSDGFIVFSIPLMLSAVVVLALNSKRGLAS